MNQNILVTTIASTVVLAVVGMSSLFTVQQTESAIVLQFGKMHQIYTEPGLKFKVPFIQDVIYFDKRLLEFYLPTLEINAKDQKRLVVDLFVRYRITDVLKFYQTTRDGIDGLEKRLSGIVLDSMQEVIGRVPLAEMLSHNRAKIMAEIRERVANICTSFGVDAKDVRIVRADLPRENSEAIFRRMISERRQEAKQIRADGQRRSQEIKSEADKQRTVVMANAIRQANELTGQGEAKAAEIYAEAYQKDSHFYELYRSYQAYEKGLDGENTTMILQPKGHFFKHFNLGQGLKKEPS
jgi:membrane protease subunit HflC